MRVWQISVGVCALLLVGGGCTQSLIGKIANQAIENRIESQTGHDAEVNIDDGSIKFTDEESGAVGQFGDNISLPGDFPADVPIPSDISVTGFASSPDGTWVTYTTNQTVAELGTWYESELTSDKFVKQGYFVAGDSSTWAFKKANVTIGIVITGATSDTPTTVMVTRAEE